MFDAGSAIGKLGLDTSGFTSGMVSAQSMMQLFPSMVTSFMANPLLGLVDVLKQATQALSGFVMEISAMDDAAGELAESLSVNVEFLSAYSKVAELNGSNIREVGDALKFLNKSMSEAAAGSKEKLGTFRELGVQIVDMSGKLRPVEDVFLELGEAIRNLPSGPQRTDAAMELLGRSGTGLITTFRQGKTAITEMMAEAKELGAVTTNEAARIGDAFQNSIGRAKWAYEGLRRTFEQELAPVLEETLDEFMAWFKENKEDIKSIVRDLAQVCATLIYIIKDLKSVRNALTGGVGEMDGLGSALWESAKAGMKATPIGQAVRGVGYLFTGEDPYKVKPRDQQQQAQNVINMPVNVSGLGMEEAKKLRAEIEKAVREWGGMRSQDFVRSGL